MEGFFLKKVTSCLLVADVLDHDENGNNLFVCIYIVFKVVL